MTTKIRDGPGVQLIGRVPLANSRSVHGTLAINYASNVVIGAK